MQLLHISFINFRNVTEAEFSPSPVFNILWGDNAQGKTNILEGIFLLGHLKSFRGARNEELIRRDYSGAKIASRISGSDTSRKLEMILSPRGKTVRINGKDLRSFSELSGCLRTVLFSPEETGLVRGPPAGRRNLLDRAVFQTDATFLGRAREYERILRQRNRLLKDGKSAVEIRPWTENLIRIGARVRRDRLDYVNRLAPLLRDIYAEIGGGEEADLLYPVKNGDLVALEEDLLCELESLEAKESKQGLTLGGPHRDDPRFLVQGKSLRIYGSQGQQRSYMLAFKTAQVLDLEKTSGEVPVLLLDDMTSELDRKRQGYFFEFLKSCRGQVFITTTEREMMVREGLSQARFYRVEGGSIRDD